MSLLSPSTIVLLVAARLARLLIPAVIIAPARLVRLGLLLLKAAAEDTAGDGLKEAAEPATVTARLIAMGLGDLNTRLALDNTGEAAADSADNAAGHVAGDAVLHGLVLLAKVLLDAQLVATAVAGIMDTLLVVLAVLDALAAQLPAIVVLLSLVQTIPPFLDVVEHHLAAFPGAFAVLVALGGVVENAVDDLGQETVDVHVVVVPGLHDLGSNPGNDLGGGFAGDFVEDLVSC